MHHHSHRMLQNIQVIFKLVRLYSSQLLQYLPDLYNIINLYFLVCCLQYCCARMPRWSAISACLPAMHTFCSCVCGLVHVWNGLYSGLFIISFISWTRTRPGSTRTHLHRLRKWSSFPTLHTRVRLNSS